MSNHDHNPPTPSIGWSVRRRADIEARLTLLHLDGMGPARIRWLLSRTEPVEVVGRLRRGELPATVDEAPPGLKRADIDQWYRRVAQLDPSGLLRTQLDEGWTVLHPDDRRWPFGNEPEPPLLLFCAGDPDLLAVRPAAAVVGTRRCTSVGRTVAHRLGTELAAAGVAVISGLALGIDAAAHRGALDEGGPVVGVVGTGLDVVYPRRHERLWLDVAGSGVLVSEYPAGTRAQRWRFPARNRLIADLAGAVVIVESHSRGGSLLTAELGADRGRPVLAVPGSVTNAAADGTNGLLVDGAIPARNAADVLVALGWSMSGPRQATIFDAYDSAHSEHPDIDQVPAADDPIDQPEAGADPPDGASARAIVEVIRREVRAGAVSVDHLSVLTGTTPLAVLATVQRLVAAAEVRLDGSQVIWCPGAVDSSR